jgi:sulfotransferase family protein
VKQINILYIGGYGRSGSTILEKILTSHPEITGGGEIFRVAEIFSDHKAKCTCGELLKNCPVWGKVRIAAAKEAVQYGGFPELHTAMMRVDGRTNINQKHNAKDLEVWQRINRIAFKALHSDNPSAKWVVDSSKTARGAARRPLRLIDQGADVRFIGMRRSLNSVLGSVSKGSNRAIEDGKNIKPSVVSKTQQQLRAYIGWIMANTAAETIARKLDAHARGLQFEDLTANPGAQLERMSNWLGLSFYPDWEARMIETPRHMIGGNRNRFNPESVHRTALPYKGDAIGDIGLGVARQLVRLGVL